MVPSWGRRAFLRTICALAAAAPFAPCLAAEYTQRNITSTPGYKLLPGVASVPAPVSVAPDQDWWGIDGAWNTFSLLVGDPQTNVRVLASTASQQIWVVNREACIKNVTDSSGKIVALNQFDSECESNRGYLFNQTSSSTWRRKGYYRLWVEKWLGLGGNGLFGFDSVGIGLPGEKGPSVKNTTVGTLVTPSFWIGHLGLHPKSTNFSAFEEAVPSYMTNLFQQKNIPSLSFGYTAGAQYYGNTVLGSLTLGGYDASKIIPNDLTFIFAPDNERDLVVGVTGITAKTTTRPKIDLLEQDDLNMFIDSTIAEMWLPTKVCKAFEDAFGLKYDNKTNLYLVDDVLHQTLVAQNPSVTFTLGQKYSTDATMQITLPYAAFDLEASPPHRGLQQKSRYFPIRQGVNASQWVLGRTFLQEAYLTVDWERQNFSVSAVDWTFGRSPQIMPIVSPAYAELQAPTPKKKPLSTGAIIGAALGGGFAIALILAAIGWWFWRRRHKRKLTAIKAKYEADVAAAAAAKKETPEKTDEPPTSPVHDSETGTGIVPKAELPGESAVYHEMGTDSKEKEPMTINEADNTEAQIFEMPGCIPERPEAGGRQLSEKESMVVRERIYNGVDPTTPVSPVPQEAPRRLAPISPSEVTIVGGRLPSTNNVSPVTPRTPRDGAFLEASDTFFQLPPYRPRQEGRPAEDTLLSPISPLEGSADSSRRRFSYES
ncbi:aspartic peptidase domain-containing protein [Paraphoma chrysanthemicola]|uniref:Aspartic peptidase domain-containing protein n=1 Tax=Paraphoma chrysanthemicola TaxID=798071 RepID=A0A8K0W4C7_9PLEO|nr:aspartic peptidase domain-containing protein [Paraphoma chrysanthemicola]